MRYIVALAALALCLGLTACAKDQKPETAAPAVTDITPPAPQPVTPPPSDPVVTTVTPTSTTPAPVASGKTYTIKKGDTLIKIARDKYGDASAVKKIKAANPTLDPNHIKPGQTITLP